MDDTTQTILVGQVDLDRFNAVTAQAEREPASASHHRAIDCEIAFGGYFERVDLAIAPDPLKASARMVTDAPQKSVGPNAGDTDSSCKVCDTSSRKCGQAVAVGQIHRRRLLPGS